MLDDDSDGEAEVFEILARAQEIAGDVVGGEEVLHSLNAMELTEKAARTFTPAGFQ